MQHTRLLLATALSAIAAGPLLAQAPSGGSTRFGDPVPISRTPVTTLEQGSEQRSDATAHTHDKRRRVRAILVLADAPEVTPWVLQPLTRDPETAIAWHQSIVDLRNEACLRVIGEITPTLDRLGARLIRALPMLHHCVIECHDGDLDALRCVPQIDEVVRDSIAPSHLVGAEIPPTDSRHSSLTHHRTGLAHSRGYTGAGSQNWAPVVASMEGWLLGRFGTTDRHHVVMHEGGDLNNPSRVLADLDYSGAVYWRSPMGGYPNLAAASFRTDFGPFSRPTFTSGVRNVFNVAHAFGVTGLLAGASTVVTDPAGEISYAAGHAPGAGIVSMNILDYFAPGDWGVIDAPPPISFPLCTAPFGIPGRTAPTDAGYYASQANLQSAINELAAQKFSYSGATDPSRPIVVANLSFGGPPNPHHPTNQALRRLMSDFDILPVTAAGNRIAEGTPFERFSQFEALYNVNGLTVGAIRSDVAGPVFERSDFSNPGPLTPANTQYFCWAGGDADFTWQIPYSDGTTTTISNALARQFPDIAAIGGVQQVAREDTDTDPDLVTGTSIAAPHVSGAALLAIAGRDGATDPTRWNALETRAALLATAENGYLNGNGDDLLGAGVLRTDRVTFGRGRVDLNVETQSLAASVAGSTTVLGSPIQLEAGEILDVALTWLAVTPETDIGAITPNWADLDLVVLDVASGNVVSSTSDYGTRTWERVRIDATQATTIQVQVVVTRASTATDVPIAWATCLHETELANGSRTPRTSLSGGVCVLQRGLPETPRDPNGVTPMNLLDPANATGTLSLNDIVSEENAFGRDRTWVAFRIDGSTFEGFDPVNPRINVGFQPRQTVSYFDLVTSASREYEVRARLMTAGTAPDLLGTQFVGSTVPSQGILWEGFGRIPAGDNQTARFEVDFAAASLAPSDAARWFLIEMPHDVLHIARSRWFKEDPTSGTLYYHSNAGLYAVLQNGVSWSVYANLEYDFEITEVDTNGADPNVPTAFESYRPQLRAVGTPSLSEGRLPFLIEGGNGFGTTVDLLIGIRDPAMPTTPLLEVSVALFSPGCYILAGPSVVFSPGVPAYLPGDSSSTGPIRGTGSFEFQLNAADPSLVGARIEFQCLVPAPDPAAQPLGVSSSIEVVTLGL